MTTNKCPTYVKKKILPTFIMGQKNGKAINSQSSCSIISVDEDVQFVVDNGDGSVFPTSSNIEISRDFSHKAYSQKDPINLPSSEPLDFSVIPDIKSSVSNLLHSSNSISLKRKYRGAGGKFISTAPMKILKTDITSKGMSFLQHATNSKHGVELKPKSKVVNEADPNSSDSDVEVLEVRMVNPNRLNSFRSIKKETDTNGKKKFEVLTEFPQKKTLQATKASNAQLIVNEANSVASGSKMKFKDLSELPKKKNDFKQTLQSTKPCYMASKELVCNEGDTAPYMPNNPNIFPKMRNAPVPAKCLNTINKVETSRCNNRGVSVKREASPIINLKKPVSKKLKLSNTKTMKKQRELKNLYENLNEISWTQETSFKNLLRNPNYIRHSERSTTKTGKAQTPVKSSGKTVKKIPLKATPLTKPSLKRTKLAQVKPSNKLVKLAIKNKMNKVTVNKIAKLKLNKQTKYSIKKVSKSDVKNKTQTIKAKTKPSEIKCKKKPIIKVKQEVDTEKTTKPKNSKKQNSDNSLKSKFESSEIKTDKKIKSVSSKNKEKTLSKPKKEIFEESNSGVLSALDNNVVFCDSSMSDKDICEVPNQQQKIFSSHFKMLHELKKKDRIYSAVQKGSQCRVRIEPLEHTNLWSTEYYEDFKKQYVNQALRKVMQKREVGPVSNMLQEYSETYNMPQTDDTISKKKKPEEESLRSSARQIGGSLRYKEIVVKKHMNYVQIVLVPNGVKKNSLSVEAIKELRDAFLLAKKDPKCKAVLLNSSGSYFCSGIDLSQLIGPNRKQACEEMATVIRELVLILGAFMKPIVAAVNGAAMGFGVSLLTYCDIVLASDKSTFCIPSTSMGYMPEGGITLTLPQIIGNTQSSEMLLQGSRLTAQQAHQKGLVSEVLWPSRFMSEVMPRLMTIVSQPLPVMEATKLLVRANLWERLKTHMDFERKILVNHWMTPNCQDSIKRNLRLDSLMD